MAPDRSRVSLPKESYSTAAGLRKRKWSEDNHVYFQGISEV